MAQCSDCGCNLPNSQTLCKGCYDARYSRIGQPRKSKSFRERLTRQNVLGFLGLFVFGFLLFRVSGNTLVMGYRRHVMPTTTALLVSFVLASIAFYVESSRQR
jgi:hypothetical protein